AGMNLRAATQPEYLHLLAQLGECLFRQEPRQFRVVEAAAADRLGDPVVDAALEQEEGIGGEIVGTEKVAPHADRPGGRGHARASDCSISSSRSKGSRPSRSSLLTKVIIGTSRNRHTSKSLRVCSSMPLAASSTITALSTAVSVRYVSSLKSWWPGLSSRLRASL